MNSLKRVVFTSDSSAGTVSHELLLKYINGCACTLHFIKHSKLRFVLMPVRDPVSESISYSDPLFVNAGTYLNSVFISI